MLGLDGWNIFIKEGSCWSVSLKWFAKQCLKTLLTKEPFSFPSGRVLSFCHANSHNQTITSIRFWFSFSLSNMCDVINGNPEITSRLRHEKECPQKTGNTTKNHSAFSPKPRQIFPTCVLQNPALSTTLPFITPPLITTDFHTNSQNPLALV